MNAAMFSAVTDAGHASGNVRAATSASSGRSATTAAAISIPVNAQYSGHIPLRQVLTGDLVEQHDIRDEVAIAVPPDPAADGRPGGGVGQRGVQRVGRVGVPRFVGIAGGGDPAELVGDGLGI